MQISQKMEVSPKIIPTLREFFETFYQHFTSGNLDF